MLIINPKPCVSYEHSEFLGGYFRYDQSSGSSQYSTFTTYTMGCLEVKNSGFMSELLWVLVSSFLMGWLISKTKQEENFYKKRKFNI